MTTDDEVTRYHRERDVPAPLQKKLELLRHFTEYMDDFLTEGESNYIYIIIYYIRVNPSLNGRDATHFRDSQLRHKYFLLKVQNITTRMWRNYLSWAITATRSKTNEQSINPALTCAV